MQITENGLHKVKVTYIKEGKSINEGAYDQNLMGPCEIWEALSKWSYISC